GSDTEPKRVSEESSTGMGAIQDYCVKYNVEGISVDECVSMYTVANWCFGIGLVMCIGGMLVRQTNPSRSVSRCTKAVFIGGVLQMTCMIGSNVLKNFRSS
ncbi:hypothetical protein KIPB_015700, partial [Kipferlia bialata]